MYIAPGADHLSEVQAWNVDTGKKVWSHHFAKSPNWGPIMTTGGGLVSVAEPTIVRSGI